MLQHPTVWFDRKQLKYLSKELLLYDFVHKRSTDVWKTVTNSAKPLILAGHTGDWLDVKTASIFTTELWDALKSFILTSLKIKVVPYLIIVSLDPLKKQKQRSFILLWGGGGEGGGADSLCDRLEKGNEEKEWPLRCSWRQISKKSELLPSLQLQMQRHRVADNQPQISTALLKARFDKVICCLSEWWFKAGLPLDAILVIFGRRALLFFCLKALGRYEKWHHFCAHAQWSSPWRRKKVDKGHLAPLEFNFFNNCDRHQRFSQNERRRADLPSVASDFLIFAQGLSNMILQSLVMILPRFFDFERP